MNPSFHDKPRYDALHKKHGACTDIQEMIDTLDVCASDDLRKILDEKVGIVSIDLLDGGERS